MRKNCLVKVPLLLLCWASCQIYGATWAVDTESLFQGQVVFQKERYMHLFWGPGQPQSQWVFFVLFCFLVFATELLCHQVNDGTILLRQLESRHLVPPRGLPINSYPLLHICLVPFLFLSSFRLYIFKSSVKQKHKNYVAHSHYSLLGVGICHSQAIPHNDPCSPTVPITYVPSPWAYAFRKDHGTKLKTFNLESNTNV